MKLPRKLLRRVCLLLSFALLLPAVARAHVGSKDVFEEATAGPYKLFVTVRPPMVIPGVAQVEVRVSGEPLQTLTVTQLPLTGEASKQAPTPDLMERSALDPNFYTGKVWMMLAGSMQVRFDAEGAGGHHVVAVPVPAQPLTTLKMQRWLAATLAVCGLLLIVGIGAIMGAAAREAKLKPGVLPTASLRRRGMAVTVLTVLISLGLVWAGNKWWNVEARNFAGTIYKPLTVNASLAGDHLRMLVDAHVSTRTGQARANNDFIADHGKIMHLYAVREPELDAVYHLHPALTGAGDFELDLPSMPAGEYKLYGDVVHATGFPETLLATITVPKAMVGRPLEPDDAVGLPAPLNQGLLGTTYKLPDGYSMLWDKPQTITANTAYAFHFSLLDPGGKPPAHMRSYLGMAGHAAFLKTDGTVFAHVHPEGSAAMAAMMIANAQSGDRGRSGGMASDMSGMGGMNGMSMAPDVDLSSDAVEFPYGFPSPGRYRIFVQMKHDSVVETGAFDAVVK